MKRQIRVLYLINQLYRGGSERALARTVKGLDRNRYHPMVCCLLKSGPLAKEIEQTGVRVTWLNLKGKLDLRVLPRLFWLIKRERVDILHSYLFHANMVCRIVGRLARVPIIVSSERTMDMEGRYRLLLNRLTAPLADRIITVSEAVREFAVEVIGIEADKLITIYNGVELDQFGGNGYVARAKAVRGELGINVTHTVIGTVGHLEEEKGCKYFLRAATRVLSHTGRTTFLLVGDGSQRTRLESWVEDLGIASSVVFAGERNDIAEVLAAIDIFVLPSLYEGLPNAVIEAMAAGRPVVATGVAGVPEVVVDGETGILVPPADAEALAGAISTLLNDMESARQMGLAGRKRAERLFSAEDMVSKTEALYETLVGQKLKV